jgi:hypothetical protein
MARAATFNFGANAKPRKGQSKKPIKGKPKKGAGSTKKSNAWTSYIG